MRLNCIVFNIMTDSQPLLNVIYNEAISIKQNVER